ncbi:MAG: tyrosine-type recombinase/integrase [Bryobacterales bacterium]|nr:tyrosine-type recombinase/integrase [Bryobacterales bacterium]
MLSFIQSSKQLQLFRPSIDVAALEEAVMRFAKNKRAENTTKAYDYAWRAFCTWCEGARRQSLPAEPDTVALWVASLLVSGLRPSTVRLHICGVNSVHKANGYPAPFDRRVGAIITGAQRTQEYVPLAKVAMTPEQLREVSSRLGDDAQAVRDRAVLVVGFATGLRRSELVALRAEDVSFVPEGLRIYIRRSKTDQKGEGRMLGVFAGKYPETCPIETLRAWFAIRGESPGPLFWRIHRNRSGARPIQHGIHPVTVNRIVKIAASMLGLEKQAFGAHSLRVGCVTAGINAGASIVAIMSRTGHKSINSVQRYYRPASVFSVDPLAGVL